MSGPLEHSPADIVAYLLVSKGQANAHNVAGWPTFINNTPKTPGQYLSLVDTAGRLSGKTHVDSEPQIHHGVQLLAKSPNPTLPFRKLTELLGFLSSVANEVVVLEDSHYIVKATTATSSVLRIGREQPEDVLTVCSLNLVCSIRQLLGEDS